MSWRLVMPDPITRGNTLRTDLPIRNDAGALVDPVTLALTVKTPSNVSIVYTYPTPTIVRVSLGIYYAEFLLSEIGIWEYEWVATTPTRTSGEQIYVEADPIASPPSVSTIVDYTRLYLGGENWDLLDSSANFGIAHIILAIEAVKRRVLPSPPAPSGESALNGNLLAYLGILSALELLPAALDAWANRLISRSTGNDPAELTSYTDRSRRIADLQDLLLRRVPELKAAALPYLDPVLNLPVSVAGIDEASDDARVTNDPRTFPPDWSFPYDRNQVVRP
jgi:hypothetical protein